MFFSKNKKPQNPSFKKKDPKKILKNILLGSSTSRKMFRLYFLILIIFACLLFTPISYTEYATFENGGYTIHIPDNGGVSGVATTSTTLRIDFFDILFMAFSAFTDTGLSLIPIYSTFTVFGKIMMMLLIQIGGFGIMFFIFLVWKLIMRKDKLSINQLLLAQSEKGTTKIGQTSKMLITSSIGIIVIEIIFGLFYSLWFLYVPAYNQVLPTADASFTVDSSDYTYLYHHAGNAFFAGFFHSVSAINNAGFDIVGMYSLAPYRNGVHSIFLLATCVQFIIGGIGFPILYDIFARFYVKRKDIILKRKVILGKKEIRIIPWIKIGRKKHYHISLLTKVVLVSTLAISLFGIAVWFIFETTSTGAGANLLWQDDSGAFGTGDVSYYNKSVQIIFQSLSTRSAGFSTINCDHLNQSTKWLGSFLMFVGGSPSSTAGGIRNTTLSICLVDIVARLSGRHKPSMFKRSITDDNIKQSFVVSFVALVIIALGGVILASFMHSTDDDFSNTIFLSCSAFGTTGLSPVSYDALENLNWFGKLYLMFLMFVGQFGISSTLLAFNRSKVKANRFNYMEESIRIG